MLAPLLSVLLFFAAIVASFWYLRTEEIEREQEAVKRDIDYSQQQVRLRLLERQEQLMRIARDVSNGEVDRAEFTARAEDLVSKYPELQAVTWIDDRRRVRASYASPSTATSQQHVVGELLQGEAESVFGLARDLQQPVFSPPLAGPEPQATLQLHIPMADHGKFAGTVLGEYSIDGLLRYGVPPEMSSRYAISLLDAKGGVLAGNATPVRPVTASLLPWSAQVNEHQAPVSPVGNGLALRGQAYRTSSGLVGNGLFWMVGALSILTAWMLIGTWRHTRRRMQTQHALVAEMNFRRAMENSMLTGMRALDMQGRITYVNAAFCHMTGWSEGELVGRTAPFPFWPEEDREQLTAKLEEELQGRSTPGGFQVRVKRKSGTLFDARLYLSPLIDAKGHQTGWMTSMTDITEPNRIREQLSASYERFTTVLEALDASVSVAPLGSEELLFANKMYRQWFDSDTRGHLKLVAQAGVPETMSTEESLDDVDGLVGLPTDSLTVAQSGSAELYIPELDKWMEVRSRYLNWVDGRLAQMVIASDITPRRQAEEQAAAQAERAQSVSRLITMGEMASSVAHELNQPLTAINNYCNGILSRIRSFVKRSEPNRTLSDVAWMVNEAIELAEIELRRRNVRLSHYVAARLPQLMVDPILIEQVLVNLIRNAAEAVDQAKRPPAQRSVEVRVVPKHVEGQGMIEFSVQDTGKGLAPEVMERLFEAFFSTKSEGMGIGLNLCRSIVESHHGRMRAENLYNGTEITGCRFSFLIPLAQPDPSPPDSSSRDAGVSA